MVKSKKREKEFKFDFSLIQIIKQIQSSLLKT